MEISYGKMQLIFSGNLQRAGLAENNNAPDFSEALIKEYGSYLLSRIVVQYHRP